MSEEDNQKVFQGTPSEDVRLENLGYEQGKFGVEALAHRC